MSSLYEAIGGAAAVDAAVTVFYKKVLADPLLAPYFASVDMGGQSAKQKAFFTTLFKGDTAGADSYMRRSHAKLVREDGLSDSHFDAVAGHLQDTLNELGVKPDLAAQVMSGAGSLKNAVLNR